MEAIGIKKIVAVVGFASHTVKEYLGDRVEYATQKDRLGTAHAVKQALPKLTDEITDVLVLNGDDSAFYPVDKMQKLIRLHQKENSQITVLTVRKKDPHGYGRIIRKCDGTIKAIIEEKHASAKQKKIKEINTACYCFKRTFLEQTIAKVRKNSQSGEFYLTDLVKIATDEDKKVSAFNLGKEKYFQGVNTHKQWQEANKKMSS
jgi:bifunctional UDP-N-acetylglucosamine pyrophosphorylase/glucosamine-1-phosphate N-acetyltransferase